MIQLKSLAEIERMAVAGEFVAAAFEAIGPSVAIGTTTSEIDHQVRDFVAGIGGEPLFLNYHGFPAHCCISVNEEIVHGIPGSRALKDGDIVSIDIGIRYDGFCGDSARTFFVGEPSARARKVVKCCQEALAAGIEQACPGNKLSLVSAAIEHHVLEAGLQIVRRYVGHGIGREMHEEPQVANFLPPGYERNDMVLEEGLVIAIEPMVAEISEDVETLEDGWTVVTSDGGLSAHCEHTVAVTAAGPRILTLPGQPGGDPDPATSPGL